MASINNRFKMGKNQQRKMKQSIEYCSMFLLFIFSLGPVSSFRCGGINNQNHSGPVSIPSATMAATTISQKIYRDCEKTKSLEEKQDQEQEQKQKQKQKIHKLNFNGEFSHTTEKIYFPPVLSSLDDGGSDHTTTNNNMFLITSFFRDPENRNLLIKGGDNQIEVVEKTPELVREWKEKKQKQQQQQKRKSSNNMNYDPTTSTNNDVDDDSSMTILAIYSTVPFLPGLSIGAVSYMGCTLVIDKESKLPSYELTLIEEYYSPKGTKTMSWFFNQIVGDGDRHHNKNGQRYSSSSSRQTCATAKVSLLFLKDQKNKSLSSDEDNKKRQQKKSTKNSDNTGSNTNTNGGFRLSYYGNVQVYCELPRRVLQLLPFSKKKIEQKVSQSIAKQIEREAHQSFHKFEDTFMLQATAAANKKEREVLMQRGN